MWQWLQISVCSPKISWNAQWPKASMELRMPRRVPFDISPRSLVNRDIDAVYTTMEALIRSTYPVTVSHFWTGPKIGRKNVVQIRPALSTYHIRFSSSWLQLYWPPDGECTLGWYNANNSEEVKRIFVETKGTEYGDVTWKLVTEHEDERPKHLTDRTAERMVRWRQFFFVTGRPQLVGLYVRYARRMSLRRSMCTSLRTAAGW